MVNLGADLLGTGAGAASSQSKPKNVLPPLALTLSAPQEYSLALISAFQARSPDNVAAFQNLSSPFSVGEDFATILSNGIDSFFDLF